jgi:uncharacterized membrane protein YpjA
MPDLSSNESPLVTASLHEPEPGADGHETAGHGEPGWLEQPAALVVILAVNVVAYVLGLLWWYGPPLNDPATPIWAWPFVPDCPLFGLLGGLALLQMVALRRWSRSAQAQTRRTLLLLGVLALLPALLALAGWFPFDGAMARAQAAMWGLASGSLLLVGSLPGHPLWMAAVGGIQIAGQVKYGIWTLTLWGLFWRNTALLYGAPIVSAEGVLMVVAHVALIVQGIVLLVWLPDLLQRTERRHLAVAGRRPIPGARLWGVAALAVLAWFALSDFVDYTLGFHPAVHQLVSLESIRISTERMTWVMTFLFLLIALQASVRSQRGQQPTAPY